MCVCVYMYFLENYANAQVFKLWYLMFFIFQRCIGAKSAEIIQYKILVDALHILDWITHYHSIKVSNTPIIILYGR